MSEETRPFVKAKKPPTPQELAAQEAKRKREEERRRLREERLQRIADNEKRYAPEIEKSFESFSRLLGPALCEEIRNNIRDFLEKKGVDQADIPERQATMLTACLKQLESIGVTEHMRPERRKLLLHAIGATFASGELVKFGIEALLIRLYDGGDIFPDAQSRDLFENAGKTSVELHITQSILALGNVFEQHIVSALYQEIQKQSQQTELAATLNEVNRTLLIYVEELQLMAMRTPRDLAARVELAHTLGIADDTEMKGVPDVAAIEYHVRFARENGSIFVDKSVKERVIKEEPERASRWSWEERQALQDPVPQPPANNNNYDYDQKDDAQKKAA